MDKILNCKIDKQTIYEIYRACRLCGAGAGYKMPIIQNVVDLDISGMELQQKIRECVQLEVHPDDKMPPLICELCVDKVNDYYEFMEMCQQTNKRTRTRLGLPLSSGKVRNSNCQDSGDCILGVTEKVYTNDDSDEPLSGPTRRSRNETKVKIKVEKDIPKSVKSRACQTDIPEPVQPEKSENRESRKVSVNNRTSRKVSDSSRDSRKVPDKGCESRKVSDNSRKVLSRLAEDRSSSSSPAPRVTRHKRPPTPPRTTRHNRTSQEENLSLSNLKQQEKKAGPKSILKKDKELKIEDQNKLKRTKDPPKPEIPLKKVKMSVPPKVNMTLACAICDKSMSTAKALHNHLRIHTVTYTNYRLACNACQDWFTTPEGASAHHRSHKVRKRPYHCKRCNTKYKLQEGYDQHIENEECLPWDEVPDVKCDECWWEFPTQTSLEDHKCGGEDARAGGTCPHCKRFYALLKNLKKHQLGCTPKKTEVIVDPEVKKRIKPVAVRVARCDPLLGRLAGCNVATVRQNYGLDPRCVYPYIRIKSELEKDHMVKIQSKLDAFDDECVHWDSDSDLNDSDGDTSTVDSLTTIALKTIFSKKLLGKVPRKRRRIKSEKNAFDSILNASEFENNMRSNIDNIIDNLGEDDDDFINFGSKLDDTNDNVSENSESLLFDDFTRNDDEKRKDNDSINSESLLCDDSAVPSEENVSNNEDSTRTSERQENIDSKINDLDEKSNDTVDSYTLLSKKDDHSNTSFEKNDRLSDTGVSTSNIDSSASNTCANETKDVTESQEETAKEVQDSLEELSRLSRPENNDIIDTRPECNSFNTNSDENPEIKRDDNVDDVSTISESLNTDNQKDSIEDNINTNTDVENTENTSIDELTNGEVGRKSDDLSSMIENDAKNEEMEDKKLMDALDEQIGETDDENVTNKPVPEKNEEICEDKSSENHATELTRIENDESTRQFKENEAMCTDIENKINDLIAENSANLNNDSWPKNKDENNDKPSENLTEVIDSPESNEFTDFNDATKSNDNITNNKATESEKRTENDDTPVNKDTVNDNNDKDKITLEDLLPAKEPDARSMDLDSISDTEFDFDA